MAQQSMQKLSLLAQYDDMCRNTQVLTSGPEEEFKAFVEGQLRWLRKSKEKECEVEKLRKKISTLESENRRLQTQMKHLKDLVKEAGIMKAKVESERNTLERQIEIIKELLSSDGVMDNQTREKLGFLSTHKQNSNASNRLKTIEETTGSLISLSEIDHTDDDLIDGHESYFHTQQSKGKRSSSESRIAHKKNKSEVCDPLQTSDEDNETDSAPPKTVAVRCNSEPASTSPDIKVLSRSVLNSDSSQLQNLPYDLRKSIRSTLSGSTPVGRYSTGGKLSRQHVFVTKNFYRHEKCNPCHRSLGFFSSSLKCQDCAVICHPECKDKCPLPCIPIVHKPSESITGTIADYTSSAAPMIPPLIAHCVNEIESRGLKEQGLYRKSGEGREVKILREKFLNGRSIPHLHKQDINVICGAVKDFLRSLTEPLITRSAWQDFAHVADLDDSYQSLLATFDIASNLPQPNRDTLAFLILHLQRVAESPECKMPISSLAKVFGPTIVSYSVSDPAEMNVLKETKDQHKIMERLLSIPPNSWQDLLNVEPDVFLSNTLKTPENLPAPKGTRLGPLRPPSGQKAKSSLSKTPLGLRNSKYIKTGKMSFSSPGVK